MILMSGLNIFLSRFGRQLRIFRKQKMLSAEELAGRVGISANDIKELEAGKFDPKLSTVLLIAEVLDVLPEDLLALPKNNNNDAEYNAYRYHLLRLLHNVSKSDLKNMIEVIQPKNFKSRP